MIYSLIDRRVFFSTKQPELPQKPDINFGDVSKFLAESLFFLLKISNFHLSNFSKWNILTEKIVRLDEEESGTYFWYGFRWDFQNHLWTWTPCDLFWQFLHNFHQVVWKLRCYKCLVYKKKIHTRLPMCVSHSNMEVVKFTKLIF